MKSSCYLTRESRSEVPNIHKRGSEENACKWPPARPSKTEVQEETIQTHPWQSCTLGVIVVSNHSGTKRASVLEAVARNLVQLSAQTGRSNSRLSWGKTMPQDAFESGGNRCGRAPGDADSSASTHHKQAFGRPFPASFDVFPVCCPGSPNLYEHATQSKTEILRND